MKMYIVIRDDVPDNFVPVICGHASLVCYLRHKDDYRMIDWLNASFKKCVVSANGRWDEILEYTDWGYEVITESALGGSEVALAFVPCNDHPVLKKLPLWKPKG